MAVEVLTRAQERSREKRGILYAVNDPSVAVEEILGYKVPVVRIPRMNLFGTQTRDEYEKQKIACIKSDYRNTPNLLEEHPVLACAVPVFRFSGVEPLKAIIPGQRYFIALTDGHHRVRYAPREVREIPGRVVTVEEAGLVHNNLGGKKHASLGDTPLEQSYRQLIGWVNETTFSFVETTNRPDLARCASTINRTEEGDLYVY